MVKRNSEDNVIAEDSLCNQRKRGRRSINRRNEGVGRCDDLVQKEENEDTIIQKVPAFLAYGKGKYRPVYIIRQSKVASKKELDEQENFSQENRCSCHDKQQQQQECSPINQGQPEGYHKLCCRYSYDTDQSFKSDNMERKKSQDICDDLLDDVSHLPNECAICRRSLVKAEKVKKLHQNQMQQQQQLQQQLLECQQQLQQCQMEQCQLRQKQLHQLQDQQKQPEPQQQEQGDNLGISASSSPFEVVETEGYYREKDYYKPKAKEPYKVEIEKRLDHPPPSAQAKPEIKESQSPSCNKRETSTQTKKKKCCLCCWCAC